MPRRREPSWAELPDDELLLLRFKDLKLSLPGQPVEEDLGRLGDELERRGLRFRPHAWLSTEWFTPVGIPGIAIPFYLAHPRLKRLERRLMLEVEGGNRKECAAILRHECGHAFQQAYRLHRRRRWQQLFGRASKAYPDSYRPRPASRRFVQHLRMYYAQSHPDEDFAETFAVWLSPRHVWRKRYAGWPALKKLEYVDELMEEIGDQVAPVRSRKHVLPLRSLDTTLEEHYVERRERYAVDAPETFDADLKRLFAEKASHPRAEKASRFLRRHRGAVRSQVARWTGEYQFVLDQVLEDMQRRCRELDLRAVGDEEALRVDFAIMLCVHAMGSLHLHRRWIAL